MAQKLTYKEINSKAFETTKLGGGYTKESVDEQIALYQESYKELEDEVNALREQASANKSDAELFRTKHVELADAIKKAENVYNQELDRARFDMGKRLAEAEKTIKEKKAEAEKIIEEAQIKAGEIKANADNEVVEAKEKASQIIDGAKAKAKSIESNANVDYQRKMGEAKANGAKLIADAREEANGLLNTAEADSAQLISKAREEADNITSTASAQAAKVITKTKEIDSVNETTRKQLFDALDSVVGESVTQFEDTIILLKQLKEDAEKQLETDEVKLDKPIVAPSELQSETVLHSESQTEAQAKAMKDSQEVAAMTNEAIVGIANKNQSPSDALSESKAFLAGLNL